MSGGKYADSDDFLNLRGFSVVSVEGRKMIKSPCYGCADRHAGCHTECETYMEFRSDRDDEIEAIRKHKRETSKFFIAPEEFELCKRRRINNKLFKQTKK